MLTAAQKHKFLREYNDERNQKWEDYQEEKKMASTMKKRESGFGVTDENDGAFKKLNKTLGPNNRNKDVRQQIQSKLDERPENHLSPGMWLTLNPQYRLDQQNKSTFKDEFRGEVEEPVDKIYFRKRDEHSQYAESLFKLKGVITKK